MSRALTPADAIALLTARELAVLRASVDAGGSSKIAAHRLGITDQTLRNHRHAAYRKLGASSLVDALRIIGWIS